jgi:aspartate oxidase
VTAPPRQLEKEALTERIARLYLLQSANFAEVFDRCGLRVGSRWATTTTNHQSLNQSLETAGRVSDFLELAELICRDALNREESCGGHLREEHQTPDHHVHPTQRGYA